MGPPPMGHKCVGIVEDVGTEVATIKPGQFVIGSFLSLRQHLRNLPGRLPKLLH
jgi:Zn-dependent alcohol dehydrogenase